MMMGKQILLVLCASTLVACVSSNSNGTKGVTDANTTDNKPSISYNTGYSVIGKLGNTDQPHLSNKILDSDADGDNNTLLLWGELITLIPEGANNDGFYEKMTTDGYRLISGNKYANMKFGVITYANGDIKGNDVRVFAEGTATDNVPATGQVTYKGDAIGYVHGVGMAGWTKGEALVKVNFGGTDKQVMGTLSNWTDVKMKPISFAATIDKDDRYNFFDFDGQSVKGQFYGKNAAELGGVVNTSQDGHPAAAAFGAKKP